MNNNNWNVEIVDVKYNNDYDSVFIRVPELSDELLEIGIDEEGCVVKQEPGDVAELLMGWEDGDSVHDAIIDTVYGFLA